MCLIKVVIKVCFPTRPMIIFGADISRTCLRNLYEWELGSRGETVLNDALKLYGGTLTCWLNYCLF